MKLLDELLKYVAFNELEEAKRIEMIDFIKQYPTRCFQRELLIGHITASAWIVNEDFSKTLLIHHKKLNKWLHPGGHCDGDEDTFFVANKEVWEETGLENLSSTKQIFDLDIHLIPEHKGVLAHYHYDVRYLFQCKNENNVILNEEEINELKWVFISEVLTYNDEISFQRLVEKTINISKNVEII